MHTREKRFFILVLLCGVLPAFAGNPPGDGAWGVQKKQRESTASLGGDQALKQEVRITVNDDNLRETLRRMRKAYEEGTDVYLSYEAGQNMLSQDAGHVAQRAEIRREDARQQNSKQASNPFVDKLDHNLIALFKTWTELGKLLGNAAPDDPDLPAAQQLDVHLRETIKRDYGIEANRAPTTAEYLSIKAAYEKGASSTRKMHDYVRDEVRFPDRPAKADEDRAREAPVPEEK